MDHAHQIALTGHRPGKLDGYSLSTPFYDQLRSLLATRLRAAAREHGDVVAHCGMALGADTVWGQAICQVREEFAPGRIQLVAHIPFPDQPSPWRVRDQRRWAELREAADSEVVYATKFSALAFHLRNQGMVDACDELLAVWDGSHSGGTFGAVRYAAKHQVPTHTLSPQAVRELAEQAAARTRA